MKLVINNVDVHQVRREEDGVAGAITSINSTQKTIAIEWCDEPKPITYGFNKILINCRTGNAMLQKD